MFKETGELQLITGKETNIGSVALYIGGTLAIDNGTVYAKASGILPSNSFALYTESTSAPNLEVYQKVNNNYTGKVD